MARQTPSKNTGLAICWPSPSVSASGQLGRRMNSPTVSIISILPPLLTPYYNPKRNLQIETFHGVGDLRFWSREDFINWLHVKAKAPTFLQLIPAHMSRV